MSRPMPRQPVPELNVEIVGGEPWRLSDRSPTQFTMIVAYRGLHCPICKKYLADLNGRVDDFAEKGIDVVAVSTDPAERAEQTKNDWGLDQLAVGYGMDIATARAWGLYVSRGRGKTSIGVEEPDEFNEPGVFLVRPDGTLYAASISTMPFARPHFDEIAGALDFIMAKDYPARGEA